MRNEIAIVPYSVEQNEEALIVESLCPQGDRLKLRFVRPTFHKRSEVYERAMIYSAVYKGKLVGVAAGAEKEISLRGRTIRTAYGFDLRVHPQFRKFGTAKRLTDAFDEYFGNGIECKYTYVAGQNMRALAHIRLGIGSRVMIPMTYFIIPVFKKMSASTQFAEITANELHQLFLNNSSDITFFPPFRSERMLGYVKSLTDGQKTGVSIWTNEEILAEQVLELPSELKFLRYAQKILSPILRFPKIPGIGETIHSWFLFDLFAKDLCTLRELLKIVNNTALNNGKHFLYILLKDDDPMAALIRQLRVRHFTMPYIFMSSGKNIPAPNDRLYVDIRDL